MSSFELGLSLRTEPVDSLMHLKARLAVCLQRKLLQQTHDSLTVLAQRLRTNHNIISDLLVLQTRNVTLTDLRQFLLALNVPMQRIEQCLLSDTML